MRMATCEQAGECAQNDGNNRKVERFPDPATTFLDYRIVMKTSSAQMEIRFIVLNGAASNRNSKIQMPFHAREENLDLISM